MKKQFNVSGMSCNHCRTSVERALNSVDGVSASVTLDPSVATIEFSGDEKSLAELQQAVSAEGDFTLSER